MITTIKEFKDKLNENLLIPRRSKEERDIKLLQNNYRKLCNNETIEEYLLINKSFDFPSTFDISKIKLKTVNANVTLELNHIPKWLQNITINGNFMCFHQRLTSLQYCPTTINGDFNCSYNDLTTLKGCPTIVKGNFHCYDNLLTSLQYCPTSVKGNFSCAGNRLTSLKYCPTIVNGNFNCYDNELTSLKYCPRTVYNYFDCSDNAQQFTKDEVRAVCDVKLDIFV